MNQLCLYSTKTSSVHIFDVSGLLRDRLPRVGPDESQFTVTSTKVMHSGTN